MHSEELINFFKEEVPKLKEVPDAKNYGMTHLSIKLEDGGYKEIGNQKSRGTFYFTKNYNCF